MFRRLLHHTRRHLYTMPRETANHWNHNTFKGQLKLVIPKSKDPVGYTDTELRTYLGNDNFKEYSRTSIGNTCGVNPSGQILSYPVDVQGFLNNIVSKYYTIK